LPFQEPAPTDYIKVFIVTILAWLGLAGLSDNMIEWRDWFETGFMQHWRSIKYWLSYNLFAWIRIELPTWVFDWLLLGVIFTRSIIVADTTARPLYKFKKKELAAVAVYVLCGPLTPVLYYFTYRITLGLVRQSERQSELEPALLRARNHWLVVVCFSLLGFIPFVFVCSTLLYEFG
jgi:hypothetical protein